MIASLTGWDWFLLVTSLLSIAAGLWRGLMRTVFGLAGWAAALIGTPLLAPWLIGASGLSGYPWVVYVLLFVAILVGVRLVGALLARGLKKAGLGGADRVLGGVLGAARAAIVIVIAIVAARALGMTGGPAWQQALTRPALDAIVAMMEPYLPERMSGIRRT